MSLNIDDFATLLPVNSHIDIWVKDGFCDVAIIGADRKRIARAAGNTIASAMLDAFRLAIIGGEETPGAEFHRCHQVIMDGIEFGSKEAAIRHLIPAGYIDTAIARETGATLAYVKTIRERVELEGEQLEDAS